MTGSSLAADPPCVSDSCGRERRGPKVLPPANPPVPLRRLVVLFSRFGPYHIARLNAAAPHFSLEGVEATRTDRTHAWSPTSGQEAFRPHVISADIAADSASQVIRRTGALLSALRPEVVAIAGWSSRWALAALLWCQRSGIPAVLMAAPATNKVSRPWKEALKRRIVSLFSTALVGGRPHRAYLVELGMASESVFDGYDVVDNDHFARLADATRENAAEARRRLGLPESYFLASGRFIEEKNLPGLLDAYNRYRVQAGPAAWDLVLLGDGELRPTLLEQLADSGLGEVVHLQGFRQYEELPAYYGLASAFVLASTSETWGLVVNEAMAAGLPVLVSDRCGCAADLVVPGSNGYRFDPLRPDELANLMLHVASDTCDREAFAQAGRALIAKWTPERFAENLFRAVQVALAKPRHGGPVDRLLVRALMARRE
jgi:1,2-diacylglycerol 3-alpha-glucosyltransferase